MTLKHKEQIDLRIPDGKIIFYDPERNIVHIDLNQDDRLLIGAIFRVFELKKDGVKINKGKIEIIDIGKLYSVAIPIEVPKDVEISVGDCIYSEIYVPGKPRVFTFAGKPVLRLGWEELSERIKYYGDKYSKEATEEVNYIILGKDYETDPNWLRAKEIGIKPILERHLYRSIGIIP
jgi:hypothetical protein